MSNPFLLLPIEIKVREFHAKLLLGCFASEAGFNVLLGDQVEMQRHIKSLPRGIYIDKSIAKTKIKNFRNNIKLGNRVVAWCEEGLVFLDRESYFRERISIDAYNLVDIFFAWGKEQAEAIKNKINENNGKIILTGNPRFDLLRYPYRCIFLPEVRRLREKHGLFILINTNFSLYNHFYGRDFVIKTMKVQGRLKNKADEDFYVKWADYLGEMYHHFLGMISHLSRSFSDYIVIIRPHPSENLETWKAASNDFPNVRVIHEGNVIPWIMASHVMIHNGCTTGVEAYMLERPALCYCPITSEVYDSKLPNALSRRSSSLDELTNLIEEMINIDWGYDNGRYDNSDTMHLFEHYVQGVNGPTACENIISALSRLGTEHTLLQEQKVSSLFINVRRRIEAHAVSAKHILERCVKKSGGLHEYVRQKFPGLNLGEVRQSVNRFRELTNRFANVKVERIPGTKSCFLIHQDKG